jgi:hypothetical protein
MKAIIEYEEIDFENLPRRTAPLPRARDRLMLEIILCPLVASAPSSGRGCS